MHYKNYYQIKNNKYFIFSEIMKNKVEKMSS